MLNRTSSHIWGRWYLPMFLLRDRLFTLMYIASFIALSNQDQNKRGTIICVNVTSNSQRPYMVVPYVKGLSESLKMIAENMGYKYILKEAIPSKASWWLPKIKIPSQRRVESSIDKMQQGGLWWWIHWEVIKNIWREVQGKPYGPLPNIWPF